MTLAALVLSTLLALPRATVPGYPEAAARAADVCATVALDAPLWPVSSEVAEGSPEVAATALLCSSIAYHESGLDERVGDCRTLGPRSAATWWQLEERLGWARDEVCASPFLAARVAIGHLVMHRRRCPSCGAQAWIHGYGSGDMGKPSRAGREIGNLWAHACKRAGLTCPGWGGDPVWR